MESDVEPAHPLTETKIDNDFRFHTRTGGEIEHDREFLVAHPVMLFHVNDPGFRHAVVVADGQIKASQLTVCSMDMPVLHSGPKLAQLILKK